MALPPHLAFLRIGSPLAPHTLEIFLDYVCPYSAKIMRNAIEPVIKPAVTTGALKDKVQLLIRLQVQPWHVFSLPTHEVAIAVGRVSPESFWDYTVALLKGQDAYFDNPTAHSTPTEIRESLLKLASTIPSIGEAKIPAIRELVSLNFDGPAKNDGVPVTPDIKWHVKLARQNSVHVSPTVVWDGIKNDDIGSAWVEKEWSQFFASSVTAK
ncbi:hypothetical protein DL93DRAFT_2076137 [Clavulina sp. PMI_390]|nr:hypothetical protein DL93DRAFT_2076137 [Clavulina sp. PMI_390]